MLITPDTKLSEIDRSSYVQEHALNFSKKTGLKVFIKGLPYDEIIVVGNYHLFSRVTMCSVYFTVRKFSSGKDLYHCHRISNAFKFIREKIQ